MAGTDVLARLVELAGVVGVEDELEGCLVATLADAAIVVIGTPGLSK